MRSDNELRAAYKLFDYDVDMFSILAQGLALGIQGAGPIGNAILESFLLHSRILIEFFYADKHRPDDVYAELFFGDPNTWIKARPATTSLLEETYRRAGKELAHLTFANINKTDQDRLWNFAGIYNDLILVIQKFHELTPQYRAP